MPSVHNSSADDSSSHFVPVPAWVYSMGCSPCQKNLFQHVGCLWAAASLTKYPFVLVWGPPWAECGYVLQYGPLKGLRGDVCSNAWSSTSFSELGVFRAVSHLFLSLLSTALYFSFLRSVFPEGPPAWLLGSALASRGLVGANWKWLCPAQGTRWPLLREETCAVPCYQNFTM